MIDRRFLTAGRALFTLELPAAFATQHQLPPHYTYRIVHKDANERYRESWMISLLTGPDNTSSYSYVGMLDVPTGEVRLTKASRFTYETWPVRLLERVIRRLWVDQGDEIAKAGFVLHHEGRCCRCGRLLTVPESVESGIGPECAKIIGG